MKASIVHESRGRMRLRLAQRRLTLAQADRLEAWLKAQPWAVEAAVHERTGCVILRYRGGREAVLAAVGGFCWTDAADPPEHSTRALNRAFEEKLVGKVLPCPSGCRSAGGTSAPPGR